MKPNLPDIIRENKDLQQILQNQKGGIMKFWAEHLDVRGPELFKNYQDQCDAEFFEDHEWDFAMTLSRDEMKCKALGKNHIECELGYLTDLKIALSGVEPELSSLVITYAEKYLTYAYDEKRKRNFPNGMAPKDLYEEVVGLYRTGGLANDCMKIVLIEHNSPGIIEETPWYRNTMFNIKMKSSVLGNWRVEPDLRLAVADMLDGKTSEECRYLAVKMMKEVKAFSQMLYSKNLTTVTYLGFGIDIIKVDKEWLRDVASHAVLSEHNKQKKSARYYFSHFVFLLMQIGRIWAAQLANHSVDMHDLEVETGCILKPAEKGDYDYYVDNLVGDNGLSQRFVVDENHARKLLSKIKHVDSIILETQKEEKEQDNFNCQVFNRPVTIIKNRPTSFHQEQRSKFWQEVNNMPKKIKYKRNGTNKVRPIIDTKPKKYKTLKYFRHDKSNGLVALQRKRVKLLFNKWQTSQIKMENGKGGCWGWLPTEITLEMFEDLFEGKDKNCNLKFAANKTILTIFLQELLKYKYKSTNGNKYEFLIEHQTNQSPKKLVKEQFGATANSSIKRLSPTNIAQIKESILILDYNTPLPLKPGGGDNDFDESDDALQLVSSNIIDLGVDTYADVKEAIKSGKLVYGKHV